MDSIVSSGRMGAKERDRTNVTKNSENNMSNASIKTCRNGHNNLPKVSVRHAINNPSASDNNDNDSLINNRRKTVTRARTAGRQTNSNVNNSMYLRELRRVVHLLGIRTNALNVRRMSAARHGINRVQIHPRRRRTILRNVTKDSHDHDQCLSQHVKNYLTGNCPDRNYINNRRVKTANNRVSPFPMGSESLFPALNGNLLDNMTNNNVGS